MRDVALSSQADITPDRINLTDLDLSAPDGRFHGAAELNELQAIERERRDQLESLSPKWAAWLAGKPGR